MGVTGLWSLLEPYSRPVLLESLAGKRLAIDASIWLHQFMKAMRDGEGQVLPHAHIIGFLRRICKLLFFGIRPIFVFDGGVPLLKTKTMEKRHSRKTQQERDYKKVAAEILNLQLKKAAIQREKPPDFPKQADAIEGDLPPNTVYASDLIAGTLRGGQQSTNTLKRTTAVDPRLATQRELAEFVEEFVAESGLVEHGIDVNSPDFARLPIEMQYELVSAAKLQSRESSFAHSEQLMSKYKDPLSFSRAQMESLVKRNNWTQQLSQLSAKPSDGAQSAHDRRVAGERGKRYALVKTEDPSRRGGWVMQPVEDTLDSSDIPNVNDVSVVDNPLPPTVAGSVDQDRLSAALGNLVSQSQVLLKDVDDLDVFHPGRHALVQAAMKPLDIVSPVVAKRSLSGSSPSEAVKVSGESESEAAVFADYDDDEFMEELKAISKTESAPFHCNSAPNPSFRNSEPPTVRNDQEQAASSPSSKAELADSDSEEFEEISYSDFVQNDSFESSMFDDSDAEGEILSQNSFSNLIRTESIKESAVESINESSIQAIIESTVQAISESTVQAISESTVEPIIESTIQTISESTEQPKSESREQPVSESTIQTISESIPLEEMELEQSSWNELNAREVLTDQNKKQKRALENEQETLEPRKKFVQEMTDVDEIEKNLKELRKQQKKTGNESDMVYKQMSQDVQELLNCFGIPYVIAPLEAESQCAFLVQHGLADGIVTDDSDVFLFGGTLVYRNMFNKSKYVELYKSDDFERESNISRNELIALAYMLGSDYTEGIRGIGLVRGVEILRKFSSASCKTTAAGITSCLVKFREFCALAVASPEQVPADLKFLKNMAQKLDIASDWPDVRVAEAYLNPVIDADTQPFTWSDPNAVKIRLFLQRNINWDDDKINELLLPVLREMHTKRTTQTQLLDFMQLEGKTRKFSSKRLESLIPDSSKRG